MKEEKGLRPPEIQVAPPQDLGKKALAGANVHEIPVSGPHNQDFFEAFLGDIPFPD